MIFDTLHLFFPKKIIIIPGGGPRPQAWATRPPQNGGGSEGIGGWKSPWILMAWWFNSWPSLGPGEIPWPELKWLKTWPPTRGWKGLIESPGVWHMWVSCECPLSFWFTVAPLQKTAPNCIEFSRVIKGSKGNFWNCDELFFSSLPGSGVHFQQKTTIHASSKPTWLAGKNHPFLIGDTTYIFIHGLLFHSSFVRFFCGSNFDGTSLDLEFLLLSFSRSMGISTDITQTSSLGRL